jgi:hypothetical protein
MAAWITENCGLLVMVYQGRAQFIHQTVTEFLIKPDKEVAKSATKDKNKDFVWRGFTNKIAADRKMKEICDCYIQQETEENVGKLVIQDVDFQQETEENVDELVIYDIDYFDSSCQQLCQHVQQWVLRFSKLSDGYACRLMGDIHDEKIVNRLNDAVLDGSDPDHYLKDRRMRRDIFMSMTMTMIWELVFHQYLFGMDHEQIQKLKMFEKLLQEFGPQEAARQWQPVTLMLLSKRDAFNEQRDQATETVVQAILQTLNVILPPPSKLEDQIQIQTKLRCVIKEAVKLSIEMRCQRAEYMMLPPLQPEYDINGDLANVVPFNASLMNERTGLTLSNEELEATSATVRMVLFPLVIVKGDDHGAGDDEIVVCPGQVLVAPPGATATT